MKRIFYLLVLVLSCGMATAQPMSWVGTWATAPQTTPESMKPKTPLNGASIRQIIRVSIGGESLRIQLSNHYADGPVRIREAYVADALDTGNIDLRTVQRITFEGKPGVTIEAGNAVFSDAVKYHLKPLQRLSITMVYDESPKEMTCHNGSFSTTYIVAGETTPKTDFSKGERQHHWYNLAAVDVWRDDASAIAILGNSITDGHGATMDTFSTWPDVLAEKLAAKNIGVLNLGIGANCVFRTRGMGEPAVRRFDRDILDQRGVKTIVVFQGVNDIGGMRGDSMLVDSTVAGLITAYREFVGKAHQRSIKIYGATITPFLHCVKYYRPCHEQVRQTVNRFIRESGEFDGVIDFDKAVRDPVDTLSLRPDFHCGDWLHPNDAGYHAMGEYAAMRMFIPFVLGTPIDAKTVMEQARKTAKTAEVKTLQTWDEGYDKRCAYHFAELGEDMPFRVCVPKDWDGKKKLPLVMFLHGGWNNESSYLDQHDKLLVRLADEQGYILVSPLGSHSSYGNRLLLPAGFGKDKETQEVLAKRNTPELMHEQELSEQDVINVLEIVLRHYPVDCKRMFLCGHSMGSGGTWYIGAKYADYWRALAPMSGPFVTREGYPWELMKQMPIFISEGTRAGASLQASRNLRDFASEYGLNFQYKEVDGDHGEMWPMILPDVFAFFNQFK